MKIKLGEIRKKRLHMPDNIKLTATKFDVYQGRDGIIVYAPKRPNPFCDEAFIRSHDLSQKELFGGRLIGAENPWND